VQTRDNPVLFSFTSAYPFVESTEYTTLPAAPDAAVPAGMVMPCDEPEIVIGSALVIWPVFVTPSSRWEFPVIVVADPNRGI
jgi:hypothetical protein